MPPAARLTDMHTCPLVNPGPVPHVGGPILPPCCPTVLIGMLPAARMGDMALCVGPPDSIAKGSPTVLIGGMMAARQGDPTVHGGVIVMGFPMVMIGEAGSGGGGGAGGGAGASGSAPGADTQLSTPVNVYGLAAVVQNLITKIGDHIKAFFGIADQYAPGIKITGSAEFRQQTREALDRLKATPTGKALLEDIGKSGKTVTLKETTDNNGYCKPLSADANKKPDGTANKGSDSEISFNPNFKPGGLPNEVVLGHELIHAQHNARGTRETTKTAGVKNEELKTVGLPPFPEKGLTENSLREDLKLPKRTSY